MALASEILLHHTSSCRIFQQRGVYGCCRQMHISYNTASDEDVFDRALRFACVSASSPNSSVCVRGKVTLARGTSASAFSEPRCLYVTDQMRIFQFVDNGDVVKLDIQVLIHALQGPSDGDVIF